MAQNIGTLITAPMRPNDSEDLIPVAFSNEIEGGLHSVIDLTDVPYFLRKEGMLVYEKSTDTTYQYLNGDFVPFTGSGGDSWLIGGNYFEDFDEYGAKNLGAENANLRIFSSENIVIENEFSFLHFDQNDLRIRADNKLTLGTSSGLIDIDSTGINISSGDQFIFINENLEASSENFMYLFARQFIRHRSGQDDDNLSELVINKNEVTFKNVTDGEDGSSFILQKDKIEINAKDVVITQLQEGSGYNIAVDEFGKLFKSSGNIASLKAIAFAVRVSWKSPGVGINSVELIELSNTVGAVVTGIVYDTVNDNIEVTYDRDVFEDHFILNNITYQLANFIENNSIGSVLIVNKRTFKIVDFYYNSSNVEYYGTFDYALSFLIYPQK